MSPISKNPPGLWDIRGLNISQPVILSPSIIKLARRIQNDKYELEVKEKLLPGELGVSPISKNPPRLGDTGG